MSFYQNNPHRLIAAAMAVAGVAFAAWFCRLALSRSDVYFLEQHRPAQWIRYPTPSQCMLYKDSEVSATFRRAFTLAQPVTTAQISLRALTRWNLAINGQTVATSPAGQNWKKAAELDVSQQLHPGTNELLVTVFNTNGPPVLWLALDSGAAPVVSDTNWNVSLMDALTQKAIVAGAPEQFLNGSPISGAERPLPSLLKHLVAFVVFAVLSAALVFRCAEWLKDYQARGEPHGALDSRRFVAIAVAIPALLWAVLFFNNHHLLPTSSGYDSTDHLDYIQYIRRTWRLPLATEGWQMYQPPLYYLISAVILLPFSHGAIGPEALVMLRIFGYCIGVAQFSFVFLSLRVLFPGKPALQWFGLFLAAFLSESLFLSQFFTNECLAAALFSAAVYFCLRILKEDSNSTRLFVGFGLCLGGTLLTKITGVIGIPIFAIALFCRPAFNARFPSRIRAPKVVLAFAMAFAVCGWHYLRVWRHFGNPLLGNWDASAGHHWWMEDGFHVHAWFFHFGTCLAYPWFGGINGFADGLYSTLWGDAMWSGVVSTFDRPPWNYELMAAGYLLALLPTALIIAGASTAFLRFMRRPDPAWFLLIGIAGSTLAALLYMSLKLPSYGQVKAFYGMIALVPLCTFATLGWEQILRRGKIMFIAAGALMGAWGITSYASYWIRESNPETHLTLGRFFAHYGDSAAGMREFYEAVRVAPENAVARTRLAVALSHQNPDETKRLLELNLKEYPGDGETHSIMALYLTGQKQFEAAIAEARKAIELSPDQSFSYAPLWNLMMETGRYREAADTGRAMLRVRPFDAEMQRKTGLAFLRAGDQSNALVHYAHAVSLQPDSAPGRDEYATTLLALRQTTAAVEQSAAAVRLKPGEAALHHHLALALAAAGKTAEAVNECHRALELDSTYSAARETLATLESGNHVP